jgi:toxin ParE1/3/4
VPKKRGARVQATGPARRDIKTIVEWTIEKFGESASRRYQALIWQAFRDVARNPELLGSKPCPESAFEGARTYHLKMSRAKVAGSRVKTPRHLLVYWRRADGVVEVLRIIHDGSDIQSHLADMAP